MSDNARVVEPTEVLTAEEYDARQRAADAKRRRPFQIPPTALGALAGELLSRAIGGNPVLGRRLGALALDPDLRVKVGAALAGLAPKKRG